MAKPESPADGVEFDLESLTLELHATDHYKSDGHTARTLVHTDDMRVVLMVMKEGERMPEHDANATATIHTLQGKIRLQLPRGEVMLTDGQLLSMAAGLPHDVHALTDAVFLLTLGWTKPT